MATDMYTPSASPLFLGCCLSSATTPARLADADPTAVGAGVTEALPARPAGAGVAGFLLPVCLEGVDDIATTFFLVVFTGIKKIQ